MVAWELIHVVAQDMQLRRMLEPPLRSAGMTIVWYEGSRQFLAQDLPRLQGAVLIDLRLRSGSGVTIQKQLRDAGCSAPAIVICGCAELRDAVESLRLGAVDLIERNFSADELVQRLRLAIELAQRRARMESESHQARRSIARLSARERQLLDWLIAGESSKVIAGQLGLSIKTVENHRSRLLAKTGARNVAELVRLGVLADMMNRSRSGGFEPAAGNPPITEKIAENLRVRTPMPESPTTMLSRSSESLRQPTM